MTDLQVPETEPDKPGAAAPEQSLNPATIPFPLVGIVGGVGSRQALESFFRNLPDDCGIAFVIAVRLATKQHQQLIEAITTRTNMPVVAAADGAAVQIDHIYVAPAGVQLTVEQGVLRLQNFTRDSAQGQRCLDPLLVSLAQTQGENAVAILLSGTGEDGIAGLQAIKAEGGLVFVQEPDEAAHPALPRRALAGGPVDFRSGVGELARYLIQVKGDLANVAAAIRTQDEDRGQTLTAILNQIATQTGHDLSHYKFSTLQRRIARRVQMLGMNDLAKYLAFLESTPEETKRLFRDCLVSVTSFFRDPDAYTMLEHDCIPQIFLNKGRSDFVRVWIAGCATGEEAYSLTIQLLEQAAQLAETPRLQIFATDIDEEAIAVARRGFYPAAIAKQMTEGRLQHYFTEENGGYRVKPEVRERVLFAVHDLLKDPPFTRLDLISCRNVLIYFNREAQEKVFDIFHYALQREPSGRGYLFLGTSESVDSANELFAVLNKHCHLYQRRDVVSSAQRRTPLTTATLKGLGEKVGSRSIRTQSTKVRTVEEMYTAWTLRMHAPPRLLVNDNYDITHLFGGADLYLQERDGAITQNVLQKILPDLRLDLRAALYQAFNKRERTVSRLLRVERGEQTQLLQLHVGPVTEPGFPQEYVEVVFVTQEDDALLGLSTTSEPTEADLSLVARMEEELLRTRERLQSVIEEYELSGQELKTSNEELQSINEELKSTTEELETSKEELQSMNEELITVNSELTRKIDELHRANSDLLNLIASTDVGAIFLDDNLTIKRFTPRATDLFNLIGGDMGRPFAHITHRLRHTGLVALAAHVRETTAHMEETVQRDDERWFMLRAFPYRTVTGELDGVVITFVDINDLKRAESEERQRRQQQCLVELSRQALTGGDLNTLLTATTQRVAEVLDMELCKALELQADGETLLLKAGVGWNEGLVGHATTVADISLQAGYTLQFQAPVIVRDLRTETRFRSPDMLMEHNVRSGMSVTIPAPDAVDGRAYGVLSVHSRQLRTFATYDVDFLQSVANLLATTIMRRRTEAALREQERRYHFIFESAGVSIWEQDFSSVKALLERLKKQGVTDLRTYLAAHPEFVRQAITLVKVRDVNRHTLMLFGAESKAQLLTSPQQIFLPETDAIFAEELIALAEGRHYYEAETTLQTLQGERRHVLFTMTFPVDDFKLERVLVSILDITKRKEDEQDLRFLAEVAEQIRLATDVEQLVAGVVQTVGDYLHVDRALFIEVDPAQDTGLVLGQHSRTLPPTAPRYRLSDYSSVNQRELEAGHTLINTDAAHDPRTAPLYKTIYEPAQERAFVGVPLLRDGRWCGILSVTAAVERTWQPRELALLETIAERTWLAVETVRLNSQLQRYADMLRLSYDAIFIWNSRQGIEFWNHGAETLYGYTAAEAVGQETHHLLQTEHQQPWSSILAQLQENGVWEGEVTHTTKTGNKVTVSSRHQLIEDPSGETVVVEINRNITAQKQAEAELRESEARFRVMADTAPVLIWVSGLDKGCTFFNKAWLEFTGRPIVQELGEGWMENIHPEDYERCLDTYYTAFDARRDFEMEYRLRRHDGVYRWIVDRGTPLLGQDGGFAGFIGGCIDITERKESEVILARYQLLSDQVRDIMLFMRLDGQIIEANAAAAEAYGYDRATLLQMKIQDLRDPSTHALIANQISQAAQAAGGNGILFETIHRRRDGSAFPVEVSSIGATVGDERLLLSVIRDITERKATEAALAASEAKFATAFSLSPLFLTITSLVDGRLLEVNQGFVDLTGYSRDEALGRTPDELELWANPEERTIGLARLRTDGIVKDVEADFRMKDGSIRTCLLGGSLIEINGQPCALTALTDITDRKAAEAALRASEDQLRRVLDNITAFAGVLTPDGSIVDINRAAREIANLDMADLRGLPFEEGYWFAYSPTLQAQIRDSVERATQGETVRFDMKARIGPARFLEVDYAIAPVRDANGTITHLVPSGLDVTERKAAERAHQASAAQIRLITDNVSGLISYVDREQRYRFVNGVYETWFGQPRTHFIGRTVQETLGDDAYAVAHPRLLQALSGERVTFENTIFYPDGITRTVLTTYVPDIADNGQVFGFYALVTDITEQKQAEERLRFLAEAGSILASSLDHAATLENVAHTAVPGIADWCTIDLVDAAGAFQDFIIAHVDPEKVQWAEELRALYPMDPNAPAGAPNVIRTGQAEFYPDISDEMLQAVAKSPEELHLLRTVGYRSVMIVPLKNHGRILGAITFVASESERHFTMDDLTMAKELAQRAAAAIGNAQLHQAVRQREEQLRIGEERLRLATEAGKIGIYDHDLLTQQTTYSDLYIAITGITPAEPLTRMHWLARVHPADQAMVEEKLQRAVTVGESYDYEYRIYRPDGELRWLAISSRVSLDESGHAVRLTGALHDITERKQAEEEIQRLNRDLKRRLDELQSLLDVAPIGIFVAHDPACKVITGNAVGAKMLGMQREEDNLSKSGERGETLPFRVLRDGRELTPDELPMQYAVLHDTPVSNWEVDVVHADGTVINLYEYATPLHDEDGKVRGCLGVFVDITERKRAEASLRASEERFRSAFEQAAVGMAHVGLDGRYLRVNERLCTILGYSRDELLQKSFAELTHPADLPTSLLLSDNLLSGKIPSYSTEKRYIHRDGSTIWVNITASIVRTVDNQIKHRLVVIEDISARKAAELALRELTANLDLRVKERTAELERSNRELDQFAYVASHDLKAPLRAIVNLATWIAEDAGDRLPRPSLEHLEKLRGRALRMERLLDDLLTYSRVGRRDGVAEEVRTEALVQDMAYLLAPPPGFQVQVERELPFLFTPRTPLELVFRNLISNAIKHHHQPEQGVVQISARDLGDFVEFEVRDNGPGIEPQYHERIFGMFQTLRPRDEVEGSGMGLAIAKRAVEYRGGTIQIASAVGNGTSFRFTWPKRTLKSSE